MVREKILIIGTKSEIREHLREKYDVKDVDMKDLYLYKNTGVKFFNYLSPFDKQISDDFHGHTCVSYLEAVCRPDKVEDLDVPSLTLKLEIFHVLVTEKTTEEVRKETEKMFEEESKPC